MYLICRGSRRGPKVNPNARLLLNFKERVDQYVEVRKKAEAQAPPLKPTEDPAEIRVAQEALAQRIRALRANAKRGGIFTPEISVYFKRVLRPAVADKTTKQAMARNRYNERFDISRNCEISRARRTARFYGWAARQP